MEIEKFLREWKPIRSECTRKSYRGYLNHFVLFLDERDLTPEAVHPADIESFAEWVKHRFNPKTDRRGLSDVAVQSHLAAVSSYYKWRRCREKTLRNPVTSFKYRRREPQKKTSLIASEVVTAMAEQSGCDLGNPVVLLLRGSGLRLAELVSANRPNLKIERSSRGKVVRASVKVKGKGGKIRIAPIGRKAATALMKYLDHRGQDGEKALILSSRKGRISRRTVQRLVHAAAASVGATCHPHELRHRFATDAIEGGMPDKQLKKHLGQASLEPTYRYIHLTEDGIERGFEQAMEKIYQRSTRRPQARAAQGPVKRRRAA